MLRFPRLEPRNPMLLATLLGWAAALFMALAARGLAGDEEVGHFLTARHAFQDPRLFLSLAGRPFVTLLLALPSQGGLTAARLVSVLGSTLCAYWVGRTARSAGLGPPWLAVAFLVLQPFFLIHCGTAMTEPWAATFLAGMLLAVTENRHRWLIVLAAVFPLVRMEAMALWPLVLVLEWRSPARAWLAALPVPVLVLHLVGALTTGDPLWLLHQSRWQAYPAREALLYVKSWVWTLGLGLFPAAIMGIAGAVSHEPEEPASAAKRRALQFSAAAAFALLLVYSALAAWHPVTFGNLRYLANAAPAFALLALGGVAEIAGGPLRLRHWVAAGIALLGAVLLWAHPWFRDFAMLHRRDLLPAGMAAMWIAILFLASRYPRIAWIPIVGGTLAVVNLGDIVFRHRDSLHWTDLPEHAAVRHAAELLPRELPAGTRLYAAHPLLAWERGVNPYDPGAWPPVTDRLAKSAAPGSLLFWDTHYVAGKSAALDLRGLIDSRSWKYAGGVVAGDSSWAGAFFVRAGPGADAVRGAVKGGLPPQEWLEAARLVQYGIPSGRQNVAADPENADMWRLLALRLFTAGFAPEAWSALARATSLEPKNPMNAAYAAELHRMQKEFPEAHASAETALALAPGNPHFEYLAGRISLDEGKVEEAIPHLLAAANRLTKEPDIELDAGFALNQLERWVEAKPFFERAAMLRPNDPKPVIGSMQADWGTGRDADAIARARAYLARRPEVADIYLTLGDWFVTAGRTAEARALWQEGLRKTGGDSEIAARLQTLGPGK
jgi:tetratricopeptide (TPR) repeat protein